MNRPEREYAIGEVVELTAERFDERGVYFVDEIGGRSRVYVVVRELSWDFRHPRPDAYLERGDTRRVLILRKGEDPAWVGSVRRLDVEGNPYRKFLDRDRRMPISATVQFVLPNAVTFFLKDEPRVVAAVEERVKGVREGQSVEVQVVEVDVDEGRLKVRIIEKSLS